MQPFAFEADGAGGDGFAEEIPKGFNGQEAGGHKWLNFGAHQVGDVDRGFSGGIAKVVGAAGQEGWLAIRSGLSICQASDGSDESDGWAVKRMNLRSGREREDGGTAGDASTGIGAGSCAGAGSDGKIAAVEPGASWLCHR